MKTFLIAAIAAVAFAGVANAGTVSGRVGIQAEGKSPDAVFAEGTVSGVVNQNLDVDFTGRYTVDGAIAGNKFVRGSDSVRTEAGLTAHVGPVYGRGAVGMNFVGGQNDFPYYSAEAGLRGNIGPVALNVGGRYRDSFDHSDNFKTYSVVTGLGYNVSKNATVHVGYEKSFGEIDSNEVSLGLSYKF